MVNSAFESERAANRFRLHLLIEVCYDPPES